MVVDMCLNHTCSIRRAVSCCLVDQVHVDATSTPSLVALTGKPTQSQGKEDAGYTGDQFV
jgi:hypothetical protein